jgi:probable HAF family extracellular repeat protein
MAEFGNAVDLGNAIARRIQWRIEIMSNHRARYGRFTGTAGLLALAFVSLSGIAMADSGDATSATGSATYSYQTLDYPGSSQTIFWGINDFGELGGQYAINGGVAHAMVYRHGHFELLDPAALGTYFSAAGGPNDLGATYGGYADASGAQHGFVLRGTHLETVDFPGHLNSNVDGYNEFGTILGVYWDADGAYHGILRRGHGWDTPFDVAGSAETYPLGINDLGESVGYWDTNPKAPVPQGFYRDANGKISMLNVPNAANTVAFAINDVGQIAGYYWSGNGPMHAFVESHGKFQTLDMPGAADTAATTINNFGAVSGYYIDTKGQQHGFIATPKSADHQN